MPALLSFNFLGLECCSWVAHHYQPLAPPNPPVGSGSINPTHIGRANRVPQMQEAFSCCSGSGGRCSLVVIVVVGLVLLLCCCAWFVLLLSWRPCCFFSFGSSYCGWSLWEIVRGRHATKNGVETGEDSLMILLMIMALSTWYRGWSLCQAAIFTFISDLSWK